MQKFKFKLLFQCCVFYSLIVLLSCSNENNIPLLNQQIFVDLTQQAGIDIKHYNGMDGSLYFVEMMGPACAFFDYDNDGDLDIYIGQGGPLQIDSNKQHNYHGVLYRNDSKAGSLHFTDVTKESGLISNEYSMGIAIGDINNDGFSDVYLTNFGPNQMFLNNTDGTFLNVTETSNTNDVRWSTSAAFFDIDGDNWLDLYVTNYVNYSIDSHKVCISQTGSAEYCGPNSYASLKDRLFRNQGDGKFINHTNASKITKKGAGLGVVTGDFNLDGSQDIYITNDMGHNFMWINNGDGTFENEGLIRGNAVNKHGKPEASMGVDAGDFDNDGDLDLFMTHLLNETNTIYQNNGKGYFKDTTSMIGLAEPSKGYTGFGTAFLDYDNDGWLDILAINGEVRQIQQQVDAGIKLPLEQANQLFHNDNASYTESSHQASVLAIEKVSRGIAIGDIDNDGDTDVLITNNNDKPQLLINLVGNKNNWIGLKLITSNGKYMLGSTVTITLTNGEKFTRRSHTDASYISANDPRVLIGLKNHDKISTVTVNWSDGKTSTWKKLPINQYHDLIYPE